MQLNWTLCDRQLVALTGFDSVLFDFGRSLAHVADARIAKHFASVSV